MAIIEFSKETKKKQNMYIYTERERHIEFGVQQGMCAKNVVKTGRKTYDVTGFEGKRAQTNREYK